MRTAAVWNDAVATTDRGMSTRSSRTNPLFAYLNGECGPITAEGIFLLMCELMEQQNLKIAKKTQEFKEQTALQEKYAEFLGWMQAAQSNATGRGGKFLDDFEVERMLTSMGYEEPHLTDTKNRIMALAIPKTFGDETIDVITPQILGDFLNAEIFGSANEHLHVHLGEPVQDDDGNYTSGTFEKDHFNAITDKIDSAQKNNCEDTTLLTTELNQLVSHQERISNMFSNVLKKFHDTEMAIIRNL